MVLLPFLPWLPSLVSRRPCSHPTYPRLVPWPPFLSYSNVHIRSHSITLYSFWFSISFLVRSLFIFFLNVLAVKVVELLIDPGNVRTGMDPVAYVAMNWAGAILIFFSIACLLLAWYALSPSWSDTFTNFRRQTPSPKFRIRVVKDGINGISRIEIILGRITVVLNALFVMCLAIANVARFSLFELVTILMIPPVAIVIVLFTVYGFRVLYLLKKSAPLRGENVVSKALIKKFTVITLFCIMIFILQGLFQAIQGGLVPQTLPLGNFFRNINQILAFMVLGCVLYAFTPPLRTKDTGITKNVSMKEPSNSESRE